MKKFFSIVISFCLLLSISSISFADDNSSKISINQESEVETTEVLKSNELEPGNVENNSIVEIDEADISDTRTIKGKETIDLNKQNSIDDVTSGKTENKQMRQLKGDSYSEVLDWYDDIDIDYIDSFDGRSVYLYTVDVSLYYDDSDDNRANIIFGVYDTNTDEAIEEMRLKNGYMGWICVGNKELIEGNDYYVNVACDSDEYSYHIQYTCDSYDGYSASISIDPSVTIQTGKYKELAVKHYPENTYSGLEWKSSDQSIAVVDGWGTVFAKKAGTCNITATTQDGYIATCKVTVKNPAPYLNYKSKSIYRGVRFTLKLKYPLGKVTYKSSNSKIATVSTKGVVKGKNLGTCTIQVKSKGKTYKCKVKVVRANPNFGAVLYDYNTRSNKFVVKVKNWGSKTLYIKKGTGKVEDVDYKSFDRKVKLYKTVKIKPKSSKTLYFKVQGRTTWYDYSDFTLFYNFTYDGKKYTWHVWDEDSVLRKNKKWYATYWDEDQYFDYFW